MEATVYNRETEFNKRGKPAIIRIDGHSRNARIQFSVEAVKLLGLKENDCITFITYKGDKDAIYFYVDNKKGLLLKIANEHKSGIDMAIYCRPLTRKLLDHFGIKSMRSFIVTKEIVEYDGLHLFVIDKHKTYVALNKRN